MKYLLKVLIALLIILITLKLAIHLFDKGHKVRYTIQNFNITETLKVNTLKAKDNYYFQIKHENFKLNFQVFKEYNKSANIINKIIYKKIDNYNCLLPIFKKNQILTDAMCLNKNTITYLHDLKIANPAKEEYIKQLKKYGYKENTYIDETTKQSSNNKIFYESNLAENHYLGMETYQGINLINSEIKNVKLFNNDVYTKPISIFTNKYYIVADYNNEYTFKKFYVVNLINGNIKEIRSYNDISFDSIMQGAVKNDVYLFDKDSQTQYKISIDKETVKPIGTKDSIKYYNGKWTTMSLKDALEGKTFENYSADIIQGYEKVDKYKTYYYLYQKNNNDYSVYRVDIQNPKIKTYLFNTTKLRNIIYFDDYIYYQQGKAFYYYSNNGSRKVIENSELEFNDDISLGVYLK